MWEFASMLQFTDVPFSSEGALMGIVQLVRSLTRALIAHARACNSNWAQFLPPPPPLHELEDGDGGGDGAAACAAAAVLKGNVVLIAVGKWREAVRNKARLACPSNHHHSRHHLIPLPPRPVLTS